jgi:hypothetical protein
MLATQLRNCFRGAHGSLLESQPATVCPTSASDVASSLAAAASSAAPAPLPSARLVRNGAAGTTVRTRRDGSEALGLPFEEVGKGSLGESGGGIGDLFHGVEIGVESGSVVAEGSLADNIAPIGDEFADLLEQFRGKLVGWHGLYYLVLATRMRM